MYKRQQMIRMICKLGDLINNDPAVRDKLRVFYLEEDVYKRQRSS